MATYPQDPYASILPDFQPDAADPFDQLDTEFQTTYGRPLRFTGRDTATHIRLHGKNQARDIGVKELSSDELKFVLKRGPELGLNLKDYSKARPHTTSTGVKITGPHIHGNRAKAKALAPTEDPYAAILGEPEATQDDPYASIFAELGQQSAQEPLGAPQAPASPTIAPSPSGLPGATQASRSPLKTPNLTTGDVQRQAAGAIEQMINEPDAPVSGAQGVDLAPSGPVGKPAPEDFVRETVNVQAGSDENLEGDVYREWYNAMQKGDMRQASIAARVYDQRFPQGGKYRRHIYDPVTGVDSVPFSEKQDAREGAVAVYAGDLPKSGLKGEALRKEVERRFAAGLGFNDADREVFKEKYGFDPAITAGETTGRSQIKESPEAFERKWLANGTEGDKTGLIRVPRAAAEKIQEFFNNKRLSDPSRAQAEATMPEGAGKLRKGTQQFAAGMTQGMVGTAASAMKGAGVLLREASRTLSAESKTPISDMLASGGDWLNKFAQEASFEQISGEEKELLTPFGLGQGLGSGATFALTGGAGRVGAGIAGALSQAGSAYDETYKRLTERGMDKDAAHKAAMNAAILNIPVGFTEMFGVGGTLDRAIKHGVAGAFGRTLLASFVLGAIEEGTQETLLQQKMGNAIAQVSGDPKRPLSEGMAQAAIVALLTGGIMETGTTAATHKGDAKPTTRKGINLLEATPGVPSGRPGINQEAKDGVDQSTVRGPVREASARVEKRQTVEAAQTAVGTEGSKTKTQEEVASVPLMITRDQRQSLADLGYTRKDIDAMKPAKAHDIIAREEVAPAIETTKEKPSAEETKAPAKADVLAEPPPALSKVEALKQRIRDERAEQARTLRELGYNPDDVTPKQARQIIADEQKRFAAAETEAEQMAVEKRQRLSKEGGEEKGRQAVELHSSLAPDMQRGILTDDSNAGRIANGTDFLGRSASGGGIVLGRIDPNTASDFLSRQARSGEGPWYAVEFGDARLGLSDIKILRQLSEPTADGFDQAIEQAQGVRNAPARRLIEQRRIQWSASKAPVKEGAVVSEEPARVPGVAGVVKRAREGERRAQAEGSVDKLTGLQNQGTWKAAQPRIDADPNLHIARLDVNDLKTLNDSRGHEVGDAYIAQVGKIIKTEAAKAGISDRSQWRTGGDEFTLAGKPEAVKAATDAIQKRIAAEIRLPGEAKAGISAGIGPTEKRADAMMYVDKRSRKAKANVQAQEVSAPVREGKAEARGQAQPEAGAVAGKVQGETKAVVKTIVAGYEKQGALKASDEAVQAARNQYKGVRLNWESASTEAATKLRVLRTSIEETVERQESKHAEALAEQKKNGPTAKATRLFNSANNLRQEVGRLLSDYREADAFNQIAQEKAQQQTQRKAAKPAVPASAADAFSQALSARLNEKRQSKAEQLKQRIREDRGAPKLYQRDEGERKYSRDIETAINESKADERNFWRDRPREINPFMDQMLGDTGTKLNEAGRKFERRVQKILSKWQSDGIPQEMEGLMRFGPSQREDGSTITNAFKIMQMARMTATTELERAEGRQPPTGGRIDDAIRTYEARTGETLSGEPLPTPANPNRLFQQEGPRTYDEIDLPEDIKRPLLEIAQSFLAEGQTDYGKLVSNFETLLGGDFEYVVDALGPIVAEAERLQSEYNKNVADAKRVVAENKQEFEGIGLPTEAELREAAQRKTNADRTNIEPTQAEVAPPRKGAYKGAARASNQQGVVAPKKEAAQPAPVVPTDRSSFKRALIDKFGYSEEVAHRTSEIMEGFASSYAADVKAADPKADVSQAKRAFYQAVQVGAGGQGARTLEQDSDPGARAVSLTNASTQAGGTGLGAEAKLEMRPTGEGVSAKRTNASIPLERSTQPEEPNGPKVVKPEPPSLKRVADSGDVANLQAIRDLAQTPAFREKGLRGLDVPSQRLMMSLVLRASHDLQVRQAIVEPVLVSVMNDLAGAKLASQVFLHNPDVLSLPSTVNADDTVSVRIDAADALIRIIAGRATEIQTARPPTGSGQTEGDAAVGALASKARSGLKRIPATLRTERPLAGAGVNLAGELNATVEADRINDNRHVAGPPSTSNVSSGASGVEPGAPSILAQGARGSTEFARTGEAIISALNSPDSSTGAHELSHAVAPIFFRLASQPNAPANLKTAMRTMENFMGLAEGEFLKLHEGWVNNTLSVEDAKRYRDGQEQNARGFEAYLREGVAPTKALRAAFEKFKEWLTAIYRRLKDSPLDVGLNYETVKAWDRLLGGEREEAAAKIDESQHWNFKRSTFASPETEARFRDVIRTAVAQGGDAHKTKVTFQEHLARVEALAPELVAEVKRLPDIQIVSREIFTKAAQYSQSLTRQAMDLRSQITPATMPEEVLALEDRIAVLEHDATEVAMGLIGARSEFARSMSFLAVQKTDQMSPENVLAIGKAKAEARGLDKHSRTWRTAAQKLFGSANEVQSAEKEKKRLRERKKGVEDGTVRPPKEKAKREPWQAVMLSGLKAQAKEASARLQEMYGRKLYQKGSKVGQPIDLFEGSAPDVNWDALDNYGKWTKESVATFLGVKADKHVYRAMVDLRTLDAQRVEKIDAAATRKGEAEIDQMYLDKAERVLEKWTTDKDPYDREIEQWRDDLPWSPDDGYDDSDIRDLAKEMQAREEEVSYDESEFNFKRGGFPPIVVTHQADGRLVVNDGNHRADIWRERGYDVAPAWVNDEAARAGKGNLLFQDANLTAEELDQVRAKFESLKKGAAGRAIKTVVNDYIRQGGLFGAELSPAQQGALLELANPTRRAPLSVEQSSLFETSPTIESRREQSQIDKAGPTNLLFQARQVKAPGIVYKDATFRVQDDRYPLPGASTNWYYNADESAMPGVSGFVDLHAASDDLLGGKSRDEWGTVYSEAIQESSGDPVLSLFAGEFVEDDSGSGVIVEPERESELRVTREALWDAWLKATEKAFPEDSAALRDWPRTEEGWKKLDSEYELTDLQEDAFAELRGTEYESSPNILFQREENLSALAHDIATILAARVAEESQTKKGLPLDRILEGMRGAFPDVIGQYEEQIKATADSLLKDARRQALVSAARSPETQVSARRQLALDVADSKRLERQTQEAADQKRRQVDRIWEREAEKASTEAATAWDRSNAEWHKVQEETVAQGMLAELQREQAFKHREARQAEQKRIEDEKLSAEEATARLAKIDAAQAKEREQINEELKAEAAAQKQFETDQRATVLEEAKRVSRAALEAEHARLQDIADEARSQMKADREAAREAVKSGVGADARARRKAEREQAAKEGRWDYPITVAASEARERIAQTGYTPTVEDLAAIAAGMRIEEGRTTSPYQELVSEFGEFYRKNAVGIRNRAAAMLTDARSGALQRGIENKAVTRAEEERAGERADRLKALLASPAYKAMSPTEKAAAVAAIPTVATRADYAAWQAEELARLAAEEAWQDKRIRNGKRDIAREFAKLNVVPWWEKATDVWGLFRSQMASIDLLHLRQGSIMLLNHPTVWAKSLWKTTHTWTEANMDERTNELETHPGADLARMSGLRQAAVEQRRSPLSILARQEEFQNRLVRAKATLFGKSFSIFPHLVVSERQYTTGGDTLRMGLFWLHAEPLLEKYPPSLNLEVYKAIAHISNIVTGVGDPGRFANEVAFLTRYVGFAPNWLLSRFQLLGMLRAPFSYRGQPIEVRRIAAREAYGYAIRLSALFALAHLLGITSFDIDDDDFLKLNIPLTNQKWDITAGGGGHIKTLLKLLRSSYRKATGQPEFVGDSFGDTVKNFARSKLAPVPSFFWDKYEGTTFTGEPFTWTEAIASRTLPMIVGDQYDNMKVDGARGLIALPFQLLGGGVSSYRSRKMPDRTGSEAERQATGLLRERDFGKETSEEANRRQLLAELVAARKAGRPTDRILAELEKGTPLQRLIPSVAGKPGGPLTEKEKENVAERMTVAPLERAYKYLDEAQKLQVRDVATPAELTKIEPTAEAMKQRLKLLFQSDEYKAAPTTERAEMMKRVAQITREGKNEAETSLNIQRDTVHDKLVAQIKSAPEFKALSKDDKERFLSRFGQGFARTYRVDKDVPESDRTKEAEKKTKLLEMFSKPGADGKSRLEKEIEEALGRVAGKKAA